MAAKLYRTFNMTGKMPAGGAGAPVRKRIHIGHLKTNRIYAVINFRVYPSVTNANCQVSGTLTHKANASLEPKNPDLGDTNQIAWSSYNIADPNIQPAVGLQEAFTISESSISDEERYFKQDLHLHLVDEVSAQAVNYKIRIAELDASADVSSIVALNQFGELLGQT